MDLRKFNPTKEIVDELKLSLTGYQPFILSDECETGVCHDWIHGSKKLILEKRTVSATEWKEFTELNGRLRCMYDDWVDRICGETGGVKGLSVADIGCNDGYFLWRFLEKGVHSAEGFDRGSGKAFPLLSRLTGLQPNFVSSKYDSMRHTIPEAKRYDITIASAIMLHLSDPLYFLHFLASITKRIVLLWTLIDDSKELKITYRGDPSHYYSDPFPTCFNFGTSISQTLFDFSVKELGFNKVVPLAHKKGWVPMQFFGQLKAFLLIRT